jgi:hypothetical protein
MCILSAIHLPEAIRKILDCLGLPSRPPPIASAALDADVKDGGKIEILQNEEWKAFNVKPLYVEPADVDIVVLVVPTQISPTLPIEPTIAGLAQRRWPEAAHVPAARARPNRSQAEICANLKRTNLHRCLQIFACAR